MYFASSPFAQIPKNLKMMYIHAYQSYIWNSVLSERVRLYGCDKPVVGDLVLAKDIAREIAVDEIEGADDSTDSSRSISSSQLLEIQLRSIFPSFSCFRTSPIGESSWQ